MERVAGVEPVALGLGSRCSTTELHPHQCFSSTKIVNFQQKETRNAKKCIAGLVLLIEILGLRVILDVVIIGAFAPIYITIAIEFRAT